jgi:hypothetical protein
VVKKLTGFQMNFSSDLTYRKHEADCIRQLNLWTTRVLDDREPEWYYPGSEKEFPFMFSQTALDTILDWSLFGRWFLIQLTRDNPYWFDSRVYPVKRGSSDYRMWYKQEFHWLQNSWRGLYTR